MPASTHNLIDSDGESDDVEIVAESVGETDKYSRLGNLKETDHQIILNPVGWLTCDIIQEAHVLLSQVNTAVQGFQRPTLGPVRNFDVMTSEFVQILHTGSDHWVCVSSIGCVPGTVKLYDSLFHDAITQEVEEQVNDLLGGRLVEMLVALCLEMIQVVQHSMMLK